MQLGKLPCAMRRWPEIIDRWLVVDRLMQFKGVVLLLLRNYRCPSTDACCPLSAVARRSVAANSYDGSVLGSAV